VENLFMLLTGLGLTHQVNLVLQDDYGQLVTPELHNLNGCQML
jgi:hypothetical protein